MFTPMDGISILICTHNGAGRIKTTLEHLAHQTMDRPIPWEIVLVDNASTDGVSEVARTAWKNTIPLRIVEEPKLGVTWARITGMNSCKYDYICFVDDDNWVPPNWIEIAYRSISSKPDACAVGGSSEAVFETQPPFWFKTYQANFAVGEQYKEAGLIHKSGGLLWGAGLILRSEAWTQLYESGFNPLLSSRIGKTLMSGEESEVLLLIQLAGWSIYYDPTLQIQHFMPSARLKWSYFLRLKKGVGATAIYLNMYRKLVSILKNNQEYSRRSWFAEILLTLLDILKDPAAMAAALLGMLEGNNRIAQFYFKWGALSERVKQGPRLDTIYDQLYSKYIKERVLTMKVKGLE